jgi:broad specificity phosphatase PhoE
MKARSQHQQFYLVLYTETDADVQRYHCGSGLDLGLTENGIEDARKIARRFKKNPLKIRRMIASPELRAVQMADVLHDEIKAKLGLWREFADQFLGEWEGKPLAVSNGQRDPAIETSESVQNPPRGEAGEGFRARVEVGLQKLLSEASDPKTPILLVTHPRVARVILSSLGLGLEKLDRGVLVAIDIPEGQGIAHLRVV